MTLKNLLTIFALITIGGQTVMSGQSGYSIGITAKGAPNAKIRLAYHLGNEQYIKDSTLADISGKCNFPGSEKLAPGVYMIIFPGNTYFEFLAAGDQHFDISCDVNDLINSLAFKGSEDNDRFIEYQRTWKSLQEEALAISEKLKACDPKSPEITRLRLQITEQEKKMKQYLHEVSDINRGALLGAITRSLIPVEAEAPKVPAGMSNPDSVARLWSYISFKDHFFDNTDLSQPGLVRSPILAGKLDQFFRQIVIQMPDSIIKEADKVLQKSEGNKDVFQYVAVWLFNKYAASEIMGHDAVVVHLADKVYLSGKATWVSEEYLSELSKRVERIRPNLIGNFGADLVMNSFTGHFVSLYDVKAEYTILYFWEPDCGHCKEATPILRKYYNENKASGIEVFAVCTQSDREKWEKYIIDYDLQWINGWDPQRISRFDLYYNVESTPLVYILDKDKKIIAKRLSVESIGSFIENYRKYYGN